MIRAARSGFGLLSIVLLVPASAAIAAHGRKGGIKAAATTRQAAQAKPNLVGTYGDWGAYVAPGRDKTCYVLAQPKTRAPANLIRDPAFIFISTRPADKVHDEVSIVEGFDVKTEGAPTASASVGNANFDMVAKGSDLWLANPAQQPQMIAAMKKGSLMVVKATSLKGHLTTDSYSLSGLTLALEHVLKSCGR